MDRLTDRKTAAALKKNADGLKEKGVEPNISDLRYIKLAEYEDLKEFMQKIINSPVLSYQVAAIKYTLENRPRKAAKVNLEQIVEYAYLLDDEPEQETQWLKDNPALNVDGKNVNDMIMLRFMERR